MNKDYLQGKIDVLYEALAWLKKHNRRTLWASEIQATIKALEKGKL